MKTTLIKVTLAGLLCASLFSTSAQAEQPGIALTVGSGSDADIYGVALVSNNGFWHYEGDKKNWRLIGHLETSLSNIDGRLSGANEGIVVAGLTPVFRFERVNSPGYIEAGVGLTYFSEKKIHDSKQVGTHFEFGDILGFGFKFGHLKQHEVGYRVVHYSNAGISKNNPGIDFHELRVKIGF